MKYKLNKLAFKHKRYIDEEKSKKLIMWVQDQMRESLSSQHDEESVAQLSIENLEETLTKNNIPTDHLAQIILFIKNTLSKSQYKELMYYVCEDSSLNDSDEIELVSLILQIDTFEIKAVKSKNKYSWFLE